MPCDFKLYITFDHACQTRWSDIYGLMKSFILILGDTLKYCSWPCQTGKLKYIKILVQRRCISSVITMPNCAQCVTGFYHVWLVGPFRCSDSPFSIWNYCKILPRYGVDFNYVERRTMADIDRNNCNGSFRGILRMPIEDIYWGCKLWCQLCLWDACGMPLSCGAAETGWGGAIDRVQHFASHETAAESLKLKAVLVDSWWLLLGTMDGTQDNTRSSTCRYRAILLPLDT